MHGWNYRNLRTIFIEEGTGELSLTGWDKMIKIGANWVQICINQFNNFAVDGVREVF